MAMHMLIGMMRSCHDSETSVKAASALLIRACAALMVRRSVIVWLMSGSLFAGDLWQSAQPRTQLVFIVPAFSADDVGRRIGGSPVQILCPRAST
jgi:hypothetical protein